MGDNKCPTCGRTALEPLVSLEVAAEIIPCTKQVLNQVLLGRREQFPRRIHTTPEFNCTQQIRMLTLGECAQIRDILIKHVPYGYRRARREPGDHYGRIHRDLQVQVGEVSLVG